MVAYALGLVEFFLWFLVFLGTVAGVSGLVSLVKEAWDHRNDGE